MNDRHDARSHTFNSFEYLSVTVTGKGMCVFVYVAFVSVSAHSIIIRSQRSKCRQQQPKYHSNTKAGIDKLSVYLFETENKKTFHVLFKSTFRTQID